MGLPAQAADPAVILGPGQELEAAGDLLDAERRAGVFEELLQAFDASPSRGGVGEAGDLGEFFRRQRFVGEEQRRLDGRSRLSRAKGSVGRAAERHAAFDPQCR